MPGTEIDTRKFYIISKTAQSMPIQPLFDIAQLGRFGNSLPIVYAARKFTARTNLCHGLCHNCEYRTEL
jgi:hypothetical protein